jgi:predicted nucleotidyltransferase
LLKPLGVYYNTAMEKELVTLLKDLKNRLGSLLAEKQAELILYGSRARGDFDPDSDIDVAVIVSGLTRELKDQIYEAVAEVELQHSRVISVLAFSKREFDSLHKRERRIALDIRREGLAI